MMKKIKKDLILLKNLIIENDPIGIIDGGAPDDEYDSTILQVLSKINKINKEDQIADIIKELFTRDFGRDYVNGILCKKIAHEFLIKRTE
ncbi:hypothetical protein KKF32_00995 [Patescibacteria group bacterium]|nr:hypothetical protein [Patescibacteria group bacterium]